LTNWLYKFDNMHGIDGEYYSEDLVTMMRVMLLIMRDYLQLNCHV